MYYASTMGRRAAKYRRISEDREGRELGIQRQDEDLDELGERRGLTFVDNYVDNDTGASSKSRKPRPDYTRMLADARAGKFEVIAAYTTGRVTRRPREFEDLIDLSVECGIEFMYVRSPEFDLRTAQGRRIARQLAAQDAGESEEISERVTRESKARAMRGGNHGGRRCSGYTADGKSLIPAEAVELARGVDEVLRGTPLGTLTREINIRPYVAAVLADRERLNGHSEAERKAFLLLYAEGLIATEVASRLGVGRTRAVHLGNNVIRRQQDLWGDEIPPGSFRTVTGKPWQPGTLRDTLMRPRLAGLSEYKGKVVGKGQWPAIITPEQHYAVKALMLDPARRTTTGNRAAYLLSGYVACAVCGQSVTSLGIKRSGVGSKPRHLYRCRRNGCAAIRRVEADLYIEERVFERLRRADAAELLIEQDRPNMQALQDEAHAIRLQLDEAAASAARPGGIDIRQLEIISRGLNARLQEIEQLQEHTSRAPILRDLIEAGERVEEVWQSMSLDRRRAVVQCLMDIRLRPGSPGRRAFDPMKLEIIPKA